MDDGQPTLGVGFAIEPTYEGLAQAVAAMDSAEARIIAEAASIERATGNMLNLGGATANMRSFGSAATKEAQTAARELSRVEKAGEALSRQLERDAAAFGRSRAEMRSMKVEAAALAAEQQGLTELAGRLRSQEEALQQAAFQTAAARDAEAAATARAAREHANLAAMVRGSQAALESDAAAAERLRQSTDPLYAATVRLNAEIAESTRLYYAGVTAPAEYARQQDVLVGRLRAVEREQEAVNRGLGTVGGSGQLAGHHMQNLAFQFQDLGIQMFQAAGSSAPLKMAFTALLQQGAQIQGVMSQAGIGIRGVGAAFVDMSRSVLVATATNPYLLAGAAAIMVFVGAVKALQNAANSSVDMKAYASAIGVSAEEMKKLDGVTITFGDTAKAVFQVAGRAIWGAIGPAVNNTWSIMKEWIAWILGGVKSAVNFMIGGFVGAYNVITKSWSSFPAVIGDIFYSAVNSAISAINWLIRKTVDGLNMFIAAANVVLGKAGLELPTISAPQIDAANNSYKGAYKKFGETARGELQKALGTDYIGKLAGAITDQAATNARNRIRAAADKKGFLEPDADASSKAKELSDAQKAYEEAVKAAKEYAAAQLDEAAKVGLSAKQLRLYADAAAIAKAPTDALKESIREAAAVREKAYSSQAVKDFEANVMQPLRDELALYGLVGPAREAAALELEKQAFLAKNMDDGIEVATQRWEQYYAVKRQLIEKDLAAAQEEASIRRMREEMDALVSAAREAGDAIARSFGRVGSAIGDAINVITEYQRRQADIDEQVKKGNLDAAAAAKLSTTNQIQGMTALAGTAKNMFKEHSAGYKAMAAAEKAFALVQLANTAVNVAAGAAKMFATLGPWAFPAVAAMVAIMAGLGFAASGGSASGPPETNQGTGTVLGDSQAKSESIKNAIDALRDVDTVMLNYSRQMANSLASIESQIGGFASLLVRNADDLNASGGVTQGFNPNAIGSILGNIPLVGGILKGLFGTKTTVIGSGLYGGAQSIGDILSGGFDASYYSDVQKKKKFFGLTTSTKYSTQYSGADPTLENQFTLILRSFNAAILAAAGPLGAATSDIQNKLNGFVLNIGKIDLQGLTGAQIEEKLNAVFGAAADDMARAAFPFISEFQKVGEGAFETLVRVASTIEAVGASLDLLGQSAQGMGIAAKLGLADQFDSVSALTNAVDSYFAAYYTKEEQAAARTAQMAGVFQSLGLALPSTLAGFRALVEAQDLTTAAGQATYATLLKLAPAFADLQAALAGAKSAADIATERADLERQLLELRGDTAALRALQLAKLDASNRALQEEIWAIQDAQAAAKAADELRKAWTSVGDSIMDEVARIRGLSDTTGSNTFASLMGRFNAATDAARGGDMDAAKSLPQLSQALLAAAADAARSRQELDRIRAQIAASLEATNGLIGVLGSSQTATTDRALLSAALESQPATIAINDNAAATAARIDGLREEIAQLRAENNAGHAATAANTGRVARKLDDVTSQSGGDAITTEPRAA